MGKRYHGMSDQEQEQEIEVFLQSLEQQDAETKIVVTTLIMELTRALQSSRTFNMRGFEAARNTARAVIWAIIQEKWYQERKK